MKTDPITLELYRNALFAIADEMAVTVCRTTYSGVLRDNMDFSTALVDADGRLVSQGLTIPLHLGSVPTAIEAVLEQFDDDIHPGCPARLEPHVLRNPSRIPNLDFESVLSLDAALRTLVRTHITGRGLLQWTTSAHAAAFLARPGVVISWSEMAMAPLAAVATGLALLSWRPSALPFALPLLALWAVSPEIARRISRPRPSRREHLEADETAFLRSIARRT